MKKHLVILTTILCFGLGEHLFATTNEITENIQGNYCLVQDGVSIRLELYSNNACSFLIKKENDHVTKTGYYTFDGETITMTWEPENTKEYGRYRKGVISRSTGRYVSKPSVTILGYKLEKDACQ
ncbi:MAG: hypothetical protein LBR26_02650 [Prevotella sp.]|jgi:hypothetical protein|nr:hypothetical protein [Prevotella sp.]